MILPSRFNAPRGGTLRDLPQSTSHSRTGIRRLLRALRHGACLLLLAPVLTAAAEPLWLSDTPPAREWAKKARHAHGGPVERGRRGVYVKRLWLRSGDTPRDAEYPKGAAGEHLLRGPEGQALEAKPFRAETGRGLVFAMPDEGFYNAFHIQRQVKDGTLVVDVAKAEALKHSCGAGHDRKFTLSRMPPRTTDGVPFEILRERLPGEDFHSHLTSGDRLVFRVLHRGEPAAGATVELVSQNGWRKRTTTGADGEAAFRMVADYHPHWSAFDKDHRQRFLVTADYRTGTDGDLQGTPYRTVRYRTSYAGAYFPAEEGYMSYVYGFGAFLIALLATGAGVYHYRLRQRRPARREAFDETA